MILVVSFPDDPHAQRVIEHLQADGRDVVLADLSEFPGRATLSIDFTNGPLPGLRCSLNGLGPIDLADVSSLWWRRPQVADVSPIGDDEVRLFTANEWHEAIDGLWRLLDHPRWMNDPVRDEVACRKALQLRAARAAGLRIPRTLMTSNPDQARRFIEEQGLGRTVFKTFSCTHTVWRETRLVRSEDLASLDAVRLAPVIFQEYIRAGTDLRITVVGGRFFPVAIDATATDYPVDFRMSLGQASMEAAELPADVEAALRRLMDDLGLVYGAIDMRRTPEGEYVFFEVNTAGEFLFVEERTGQPIARAVADWLAGVQAGPRPA